MQIDHLTYPHIITAILTHASPSVHLAFRATSKHYRDLTDEHLARHLVLARINGEATLRSANGVLRLYPLSGGPQRPRQKHLLTLARVLDIHIFTVKIARKTYPLLPPLLDIVRVYAYNAIPPRTHTVLCAASVTLPWRVERAIVLLPGSGFTSMSERCHAPGRGWNFEYVPPNVGEVVQIRQGWWLGSDHAPRLGRRDAMFYTESGAERVVLVDTGVFGREYLQETMEWGRGRLPNVQWWLCSEEEYASSLGEEEAELLIPGWGRRAGGGEHSAAGGGGDDRELVVDDLGYPYSSDEGGFFSD